MAESQAFTDLQSAAKRVFVRTAGIVGTPGAATGLVNTTVLQWGEAPTTLQGSVDLVTVVNDADLGTSVQLRAPGLYEVELYLTVLAAAGDAGAPAFGISQDVEAAGLLQVPEFSLDGMLDVSNPRINSVTVAGSTWPLKIVSWLEVTDAQARQVVGGITGSIVRFHGSEQDGTDPSAALVGADSYFQIQRLRDAYTA